MVDTGNKLRADLNILSSESLEKRVSAPLNTVAETDGLDSRVPLHISREDRHGVCVVEEESVGADLLHIAGKALEYVYGAKTAEDASDTERVGYRLTKSVLFRYLKVYNSAWVIKTNLNCVDDEARAAKSVLSVFNAEVFADFCLATVIFLVEKVDNEE